MVLMLVETFNGIRPVLLEELPCLRKELREKHRISGVGQRVNGPASGRPEPPKVRPAGRCVVPSLIPTLIITHIRYYR